MVQILLWSLHTCARQTLAYACGPLLQLVCVSFSSALFVDQYIHRRSKMIESGGTEMGVWNQRTGAVEWTTGMEYWNAQSLH